MSRELHTPKLPVQPPATYRQSVLTLMDSCPYAGYLYKANEGGVPSHPMHRGSAFHATVGRCIETLTATGNTTIAPDDAKVILLEVLSEHHEWVVPAAQMEGLRIMVYRWALNFELPKGARSETPFYMQVAGQTVTGTIDLLWVEGDTVHIRDYKSGWGLYPQSDVSSKVDGKARGAKASQLIIYSLLCSDGRSDLMQLPAGINKFDVRYVFPLWSGEDGEGLAERGVVISRPELIEHREWLDGLVTKSARAFRENKFAAVPDFNDGGHCSRCPASWSCPLPPKVRGGSPFERKPQEVAEDYMWLKRDADQIRKELKAFAKEYGPIPCGVGSELSFKQTEGGGVRFGINKVDGAK